MSKFVKLAGLSAVLVGAIALTAGTAQALTCGANIVSAPAAGETDVPTNTLIWGWGYLSSQSARLLGPSGEVVAIDKRILPVSEGAGYLGRLPVLVPREPLEPNAEYTIVVDHGAAYAPSRSTFTTGAGPVSGAPALPELLSSERSVGGGGWGLTRGLTHTFAFEGILIGDTGQLGDSPDLDALFEAGERLDRLVAEPSDDDDALPFIPWVARTESVFTGISPCGVWPRGASEAELGRFGVLDLAGHFSGWIEVPIELPSQEEAERAAAEQQLETPNGDLNVQHGRPPACSIGRLDGSAAGRGDASLGGLLALGLALAAAGGRRAWRRPHSASDGQLDGAASARRT